MNNTIFYLGLFLNDVIFQEGEGRSFQKVILGDQGGGTSKNGPKMGDVIYECSHICFIRAQDYHISNVSVQIESQIILLVTYRCCVKAKLSNGSLIDVIDCAKLSYGLPIELTMTLENFGKGLDTTI